MKTYLSVGNILTIIVLSVSLLLSTLAATMSYGSLRTQVTANKEDVEDLRRNLAPAVQQLAVNVGELTQQIKLHTHEAHSHSIP